VIQDKRKIWFGKQTHGVAYLLIIYTLNTKKLQTAALFTLTFSALTKIQASYFCLNLKYCSALFA